MSQVISDFGKAGSGWHLHQSGRSVVHWNSRARSASAAMWPKEAQAGYEPEVTTTVLQAAMQAIMAACCASIIA